ncbi:nucleolar protein 56 [Tribolium castaneum]|uniref:Nucleolar protein 56 n=1 Tax=Tribolium castaneum TaxID=7070 RepID=D6X0P4_TRICA|nr:PREDICTED: nucleolar protein 56 [Tribolium castaneum]EFA10126.1 Nucleolar protein 56-like Protein [Tribolium castaneum]|eukprot:XP_973514.1 PREDICTED: nucleolar protein 56 [Tribolium castaneum]
MSKLYVLFEHAAGYGVFKVQEFEEIGMLLPQLEAAVHDLARFNSVVELVGFSPFKTAIAALESINAISEGVLPEDLLHFLDITVPKSKKKNKLTLGVSDPKLGAAITEALGIQCSHVGAVPEVIRGIRHHFHNLVKGFTQKSSAVAQLGLGHAYSRAKVKFNVHRVDNMIIQSIALLDQLDKDINTFSMRIREWYSYHFPELVKIVPENYTYARLAKFIKNRKELSEDSLEGLEEITMDSGKAQAILDASKSSMGMDISVVDLLNIEMFAGRVIALADYRNQLSEYLKTKMTDVAPNLAKLIGEQVGARLIAHAGSLTNLAKYPASTVQILGAEKALFRALKTRGNTPKYGLLFHSTFIGRAGAKNKGRISRYLANKCSIASRIDCFTEQPTQIFGEKLRQQVEDRLKFYETGDVPKKNIEVMKEAMEELEQETAHNKSEKKKKKKKHKLNETSESVGENGVDQTTNGNADEAEEPPKKKKKKNKQEVE